MMLKVCVDTIADCCCSLLVLIVAEANSVTIVLLSNLVMVAGLIEGWALVDHGQDSCCCCAKGKLLRLSLLLYTRYQLIVQQG